MREEIAQPLVGHALAPGQQHEERAGHIVHYAFGTAWGGIYGVMAGSLPSLLTLKGGAAFGGCPGILQGSGGGQGFGVLASVGEHR